MAQSVLTENGGADMEGAQVDMLTEEAIEAGGGEYLGVQRGSRRKGIPDLILFNDPLTGTTLALMASRPITVQKVEAKIARSRAEFARYGDLDSYGAALKGLRVCSTAWNDSCSIAEVKDSRP